MHDVVMTNRLADVLLTVNRELSEADVIEQAERLAAKLGKSSVDALFASLDSGELSGRPEELRARMLRYLLGIDT